ncbi:MAG: nuclear transport factor 2 family protein [Pseudomonadota bacterium]|nr:nuclear transport factor 2 family protein [Pseudomonadota bacterium]
MDPVPASLNPAAAASLQRWHGLVEAGSMEGLSDIVHPDAVFRSPAVHAPYPSAAALTTVLGAALQVFEDFTYHRQFASADGMSAVLEFTARVGDKELKGIDMIRFDDAGKIVEFEVMVRPASGLMALAQAMGARLGDKAAGLKEKA